MIEINHFFTNISLFLFHFIFILDWIYIKNENVKCNRIDEESQLIVINPANHEINNVAKREKDRQEKIEKNFFSQHNELILTVFFHNLCICFVE